MASNRKNQVFCSYEHDFFPATQFKLDSMFKRRVHEVKPLHTVDGELLDATQVPDGDPTDLPGAGGINLPEVGGGTI